MDFNNLNVVDYAFLAVFFFGVLSGLGRGFIREIIALFTLIAAIVIAVMCSDNFAHYFLNATGVQSAVNQASSSMGVNASQPVSYIAIAISFALLFAATMLIGSLIGYFINMAFQYGILGLGNRLLGAAFGGLKGFAYCVVLAFLVQLTSFSSNAMWQHSQVVAMLQPGVVWLGNTVSPSLAGLKDRFGNAIQGVNSSIQNATRSIAQ